MIKTIKLTQNKTTVVDASLFEKAMKYKWYASSNGYAVTRPWSKETKTYSIIYLHRFLMNPGKDQCVDHINGDRLDNRIVNLRLCSKKENFRNSLRLRKNNTTGHKGVYLMNVTNRKKKWYAAIMVDYKKIHLGCFENIKDASRAYQEASVFYFKNFSNYVKGQP